MAAEVLGTVFKREREPILFVAEKRIEVGTRTPLESRLEPPLDGIICPIFGPPSRVVSLLLVL